MERSAVRLQVRGQPIVVARLRDGVITEPRPERRGVGNGRLAEVEKGADFRPLSFECAVAAVERDRASAEAEC